MRAFSLVSCLIYLANLTKASSITYTTVTGFFLQDLNGTNATTFDYTAVSFGLINQTYPTDHSTSSNKTQWQRFTHYVASLNHQAPRNTTYKVLFMGRHGEGYHNAAESYYGTPAWNCYYSLLNGNSTTTWSDAQLTTNGIRQAQIANAFWKSQIARQKTPVPQAFYTSPLSRCLATLNFTFPASEYYPSHGNDSHHLSKKTPVIKELLREGISLHTCDRRSNKSTIHTSYPNFRFESNFTQHDPLWNPVYAETGTAQDARSKVVLDDIFNATSSFNSASGSGSMDGYGGDDLTWLSITSHSGEIASLLRVLGHRAFSLNTGAIIPVLVKAVMAPAVVTSGTTMATMTVTSMAPARTTSLHCTVLPLTSVSNGACVCQSSAAPVTTPLVTGIP